MRLLAVLALVAASWAVTLGLLWLAVVVHPLVPLGIVGVLVGVAAEPTRLVGR